MKLFEFKNFNELFDIEIKRFDDYIELKILTISKLLINESKRIGKWMISIGDLKPFIDFQAKILFLNYKE
jgi:hypothetical protein